MSKPVPVDQLSNREVSEDLFDYAQIRDYARFLRNSLRRHRGLLILMALGLSILSVLLVRMIPKTYNVQTKLLAQRNSLMAAIGNPHRNMNIEDAPTRAAYETVLSRDNLEALIKQNRLIEHWEAHREPVMRVKDFGIRLFTGPLSDDEKLDAMVGTLEKKFSVLTGEGTITIGLDWRDAVMAEQLVEGAQQNFLEQRHVAEVNSISEEIGILESHASHAQVAIEDAMTELQKVAESKRKSGAASRPAPVPRPSSGSLETPQQELAQLKFLIRSKRRAISDLEEFRSRRLTELQAQVAEQKMIYSSNHPAVLETEQRLAAMQQDSPQILALKRDEDQLIAEYRARGGKDPNSMMEPGSGSRSLPDSTAAELFAFGPNSMDDPVLTVARDQLRIATAKYHDLLMRIDAAKIELDTARAAFKFRYSVVKPPQVPRKPIKPNVPLLTVTGIFMSLMFSIFAVVVMDLYKGKLLEKWQVEKKVNLPVLAELDLP